ncbi:MAG TPA: hypothetical protein VGR07_05870, partial [Thermoanaerobaculia bacterium]|nr:hypothetical protein [Thermoanaerobaculia bacterium]
MELIDVESLGQGGMAIRHSLAPYLQAAESGDPVRTVGWVDARRGFVSFHSRGTWVLPRHPIAADDPASVLDQSFGEKVELRIQNHPLSQLLFIVPLDAPAARRFVLGNRRGEIFAWDGDANGEVERVDLWPEGEEPALVSDIAVLWNDSQREECKQARGVFIATDRGVHLVYGDGPALRRVRLDLPGLGAVCMVIAYAESRNAGPCHVWAADSRGDSHLYWGDPSQDLAQINFRASGISHAGSQSTRAVSWFQEEGHSLMVGQARRNNQIVLFEYRDIEQAREDDDVGKIRRLLSQGSKQAIRDFWKSHEDASSREIGREWPLAAQLSELFEVLAEESSTLKPLLEFLGDPTARVAWEILEEILLADNAEKACEAIELWTLSLLGIVNRTGGDLQDPQREAAYLGIVRWLLDLRQRGASSARACEAVIREIDESIGIVRKWGLFGEANGLRENLVLPLSVLRAQDQAEQGLDRLTYEVLLFERGLDLRAEDRRGKLPGRNAWDISGLELGGRKFFAVSWHWGGVELCELQQGAGQELEFKMHLGVAPRSLEGSAAYRFQVLAGDEIAARDPQRIQRSQFGHSRAVLLAKLATGTGVEKGFLLTAPALSADSQESFHLWELVLHGDRIETRGSQPYDPSLPAGESVYSLL